MLMASFHESLFGLHEYIASNSSTAVRPFCVVTWYEERAPTVDGKHAHPSSCEVWLCPFWEHKPRILEGSRTVSCLYFMVLRFCHVMRRIDYRQNSSSAIAGASHSPRPIRSNLTVPNFRFSC